MEVYDIVCRSFPGEVVLEDRLHLTLGARLKDLESQGYLVSIIVGDKVTVKSWFTLFNFMLVYFGCRSQRV